MNEIKEYPKMYKMKVSSLLPAGVGFPNLEKKLSFFCVSLLNKKIYTYKKKESKICNIGPII